MPESKLLEFSDQLESPSLKTLTSKVESDMEGESKMNRARLGGSEDNEDRLSGLPDCILLHILALMNTKQVVQTSVLSKRWKDLWKQVPVLQLHSSKFKGVSLFYNFVTDVLSCRDGSAALRRLDFQRLGSVNPQILERVLRYAVSHSVQQLRIYVDLERRLDFSTTIFSCQSLTSLELKFSGKEFLLPKSLCLRDLTNLHLSYITFCPSDDGQTEPFSACKMLQTLVINHCTVKDAKIFSVLNASVANLTMRSNISDGSAGFKIVLSTPNLQSFAFETCYPHEIVGSNLSFLEKVCIDATFNPLRMKSALILNSWLQVFTDVKSMTLSSTTLEALSLIPYLRNTQPHCFGKLNSLKVLMRRNAPAIPGVVDYLLQNSPSAEVTFVNSEGEEIYLEFNN